MSVSVWREYEETRNILRNIYKKIEKTDYPFYVIPNIDNIETNLATIELELGLIPGKPRTQYFPEYMRDRLIRLLLRVSEPPISEKELLAYLWTTLLGMSYSSEDIKQAIREVLYDLE